VPNLRRRIRKVSLVAVDPAQQVWPARISGCAIVALLGLLSPHVGRAQQPQDSVSGVVTSVVSGLPLPGVNVSVRHSTQRTRSNAAGRYTVQVPSLADTLHFSLIGYHPQDVAIDGRRELDAQLAALPAQLEAQVVTAYRPAQDRGAVTGAVSSVTGADVADVPVDNLSNALQGRLSGVSVVQNAGTPGRESNIRVRAVGTFNNADPLYVIDGVVSDKFAFDGLNSEDVANISVLKDGATAALYGSRAANGVILVTTRRGAVKPTEFAYTVTVGAQDAPRIPPTLDAYQHARTINDFLSYNKIPTTDVRYYTDDELQYFQTHSWDWISALWKQPLDVQHALSITGGSDGVRYFLGGSFLNSTGSFDNLSFGRTTARGNLDVDLTSHLKASVDFNGARQNRHGPSWTIGDWKQEDLYKALALRTRMVPPYQDGLPVGNWVEWNPGVVISNQSGYDRRQWSQLNVRGRLEYQVPWVTGLRASLAYYKGYTDSYEKQFNMPYDMTLFNTWGLHNHIIGDSAVGIRPRSAEEFLLTKNAPYNQYQLNAQVTYQHAFGRHAVDALFVYEQAASDTGWAQAQRDSFVTAIDQYIAGSTAPENQRVSGTEAQTARLSYVGSVGYSYADRYYLQGSFRYDGSVIFAPGKRWGLFPSVSAGWRLSQEPFFKVPFINELKLRASYGMVGNDDVGAFQWTQKYVITTGAVFNNPTTGLAPGSLANPDITWEKSQSYNVGLDSRFWDNRMSLTFDLFNRHTYDILGDRQQAVTDLFGASLPDENWEVVNGHGFEVELGYTGGAAPEGGAVKYYVRGNVGYAANKVVKFNEAQGIRPYLSRIGRPTSGNPSTDNLCFGYIATGILRTQADLDALPPGYTINGQTPQLGMLNYKDLRGDGNGNDAPDGKITSSDQAWLCDYATSDRTSPPITYGLNFGFSWKGLSLDGLLSGGAGNKLMMQTDGRAIQGRAEESSYGYWADHWTPDHPDAAYPGYFGTGYKTTYPQSTFWLRDGSFLRLKALTVSYGLPQHIARVLGLAGARVYLTGTNLLLLIDHVGDWGFDPEMSNIRAYPLMRTFTLGMSANLRRTVQ
jgi:TonB-linked SusC/RagA family outer membrane protein